jgi:hypothetical protein
MPSSKRKRPYDLCTSGSDARQQKVRARIEALEAILDAAESHVFEALEIED